MGANLWTQTFFYSHRDCRCRPMMPFFHHTNVFGFCFLFQTNLKMSLCFVRPFFCFVRPFFCLSSITFFASAPINLPYQISPDTYRDTANTQCKLDYYNSGIGAAKLKTHLLWAEWPANGSCLDDEHKTHFLRADSLRATMPTQTTSGIPSSFRTFLFPFIFTHLFPMRVAWMTSL